MGLLGKNQDKLINKLFSQLKLRPISLNREHIKICNENVIIHVRGGDFLKIKNLNIFFEYFLCIG